VGYCYYLISTPWLLAKYQAEMTEFLEIPISIQSHGCHEKDGWGLYVLD
jgi:hypothetical protein